MQGQTQLKKKKKIAWAYIFHNYDVVGGISTF